MSPLRLMGKKVWEGFSYLLAQAFHSTRRDTENQNTSMTQTFFGAEKNSYAKLRCSLVHVCYFSLNT